MREYKILPARISHTPRVKCARRAEVEALCASLRGRPEATFRLLRPARNGIFPAEFSSGKLVFNEHFVRQVQDADTFQLQAEYVNGTTGFIAATQGQKMRRN